MTRKQNRCVGCGASISLNDVECGVCESARIIASKQPRNNQEIGIENYIQKVEPQLYVVNDIGGVRFGYGQEPRPMLRKSWEVEPIHVRDTYLDTQISDMHKSEQHNEHFDIEDRVLHPEIRRVNITLNKMHFDESGDRVD